MRILLVEDDETMVEVLVDLLSQQTYIVDVARDGETGWELAASFPYDLVLLDVILPKLDGISFCRRLRQQQNQVLVMLLTARDTTTDKLVGLESGADDYVVKPFNPQEIVARIRALLRRGSTPVSSVLICGGVHLNPNTHEVTYKNQLLQFSRTEYLLLELFLRNQQRVYSCREIVDHLWSLDADPPNDTTIRSHIKNIRKELKAVGAGDFFKTVYGQGYRINPEYLSSPCPKQPGVSLLPLPGAEAALLQEGFSQSSLPGHTTSTQGGSRQAILNFSLAEIWERKKKTSFARVEILEQTIQALKAGTLDQAMLDQANQISHKLAGSLGMFGFDNASALARKCEAVFQKLLHAYARSQPISQTTIAHKLEQLIVAIRQEIEGPAQLKTNDWADDEASCWDAYPNSKILALDDDPQVLQILKVLLEPFKIQINCLDQPEAFWDVLRKVAPDLLILDINMPLMNGIELCRSVRQNPEWNWLPILFLSTDASSSSIQQAFSAGADDYVTKPINKSTLTSRIFNRFQRVHALRNRITTELLATNPLGHAYQGNLE